MTTIDQNDTNPAPEAPDSAPLALTGASAPQASPGTPAAASAPVAEGASTQPKYEDDVAIAQLLGLGQMMQKQRDLLNALCDVLAAVVKGEPSAMEKAEALLAEIRKHLPA